MVLFLLHDALGKPGVFWGLLLHHERIGGQILVLLQNFEALEDALDLEFLDMFVVVGLVPSRFLLLVLHRRLLGYATLFLFDNFVRVGPGPDPRCLESRSRRVSRVSPYLFEFVGPAHLLIADIFRVRHVRGIEEGVAFLSILGEALVVFGLVAVRSEQILIIAWASSLLFALLFVVCSELAHLFYQILGYIDVEDLVFEVLILAIIGKIQKRIFEF